MFSYNIQSTTSPPWGSLSATVTARIQSICPVGGIPIMYGVTYGYVSSMVASSIGSVCVAGVPSSVTLTPTNNQPSAGVAVLSLADSSATSLTGLYASGCYGTSCSITLYAYLVSVLLPDAKILMFTSSCALANGVLQNATNRATVSTNTFNAPTWTGMDVAPLKPYLTIGPSVLSSNYGPQFDAGTAGVYGPSGAPYIPLPLGYVLGY